MSQPIVCALLTTSDQPDMARRAVASFHEQTYPHDRKCLVIYDTGAQQCGDFRGDPLIHQVWIPLPGRTRDIGEIRQCAAAQMVLNNEAVDIFINWDDNSLSHHRRMEEQVALLQANESANCVGYSDMLLWDVRLYAAARERHERHPVGGQNGPMVEGVTNEAWLYLGPQVAASACYWRKAWQNDFPAGLNIVTVPSTPQTPPGERCERGGRDWKRNPAPRMMICIDGKNEINIDESNGWLRVPEWDSYCREWMAR